MRKFKMMMAAAGIFALALGAMADVDAREYRLDVSGTNTVSKTYTVRGELTAVHVVPPANGDTGQVTVASSELTLFDKSGIDTRATWLPRVGVHTTSGGATATNSISCAPMSGPVTVTVEGNSGKTTNKVWLVRLLYKR